MVQVKNTRKCWFILRYLSGRTREVNKRQSMTSCSFCQRLLSPLQRWHIFGFDKLLLLSPACYGGNVNHFFSLLLFTIPSIETVHCVPWATTSISISLVLVGFIVDRGLQKLQWRASGRASPIKTHYTTRSQENSRVVSYSHCETIRNRHLTKRLNTT